MQNTVATDSQINTIEDKLTRLIATQYKYKIQLQQIRILRIITGKIDIQFHKLF